MIEGKYQFRLSGAHAGLRAKSKREEKAV